MTEQTAAEMRNIADTFNENDVNSWTEAALKDIKTRAEAGFYSAEIHVSANANDRNALVSQLERRGFKVTDVNPYIYRAQVSWS